MNLFWDKRRQLAVYRSLKFNDTPRLWPGFAMSDEQLRQACYEDYLGHGLKELLDANLAVDCGECEGQHFVVYSPTAINNWEGYDLLECVFPARGSPLVRMVDELSQAQREHYRRVINSCYRRFWAVAEPRGESFERCYFLQHVAPYQLTVFKNSYPQLHSHTFGFIAGAQVLERPTPQALRTFLRHNLFYDLFTDVSCEVLAHDFGGAIQVDSRTHSIIISARTLEGRISHWEMEAIATVSRIWKERWRQLAACFCDLPRSEQFNVHEVALFDRKTRSRNLEVLFSSDFSFLSERARGKLYRLAERLTTTRDWSDTKHNWKNVMTGPYGSIGVVFDYPLGRQELRVAPRTFGSTRTGATDGTWLTLKHRSFEMEAAARERLLHRQRTLMSTMDV